MNRSNNCPCTSDLSNDDILSYRQGISQIYTLTRANETNNKASYQHLVSIYFIFEKYEKITYAPIGLFSNVLY